MSSFVMEIAGWLGLIFTTLGVILTARKNIWCWIFLLTANIFWTVNLWYSNSAVLMQVILAGFNIYGFMKWLPIPISKLKRVDCIRMEIV